MDGARDLLSRHGTKRTYSTMSAGHRYPGDGFDYRRPRMSINNVISAAAPVIDLTDDDHAQDGGMGTEGTATAGSSRARRLPRFGRDLIEVADREPEPERPAPLRLRHPLHPQYAGLRRPERFRPNTPPDMDDELEIVSERAISRPASRHRTREAPRDVPALHNLFDDHIPTIDITDDDDEDDEVVYTNTRIREGGLNATRPGTTAGVGTWSEAEGQPGNFRLGAYANILHGHGANMAGRLAQQVQHLRGDVPARLGVASFRARNEAARRPTFAMPDMMAYDAPAFDLGLRGGNQPETPKYSPPPEVPEGFTRNPAEDEVVVCPNCGDELAMGDSEVKQQVWVIKQCGHAYCGDCALTRKVAKKGKAKASPPLGVPALKHCVVDKKPTKGMFQVYLGA